MRRGRKKGQSAAMAVTAIVCGAGLCVALKGGLADWRYRLSRFVIDSSQEMYLPMPFYQMETQGEEPAPWLVERSLSLMPLTLYAKDHAAVTHVTEDEATIAKILESQANDENAVDQNGKLIGDGKAEDKAHESKPTPDISIEKLKDFDYLLSHFYTVDSSTMIGAKQLDAEDLLSRSMKIDNKKKGPKVLIFHTHSQEGFKDSVKGDTSTTIVGMGEYLTELLNGRGVETIHDSGVYDVINGKLDRSNAYENAEASIRPILEKYPSIQVVIDLHRDGVAEGTHLVSEINGKPTARIMYFNGLSRSRTNGDIKYLHNPYIQDNLAFSLQMQLASEKKYPGYARRIYLKAYRYNLHLMPKSLLVEAGAQTNTVTEMRNAMEVLADTLCSVIL